MKARRVRHSLTLSGGERGSLRYFHQYRTDPKGFNLIDHSGVRGNGVEVKWGGVSLR